jgi:O-antigen ligase
MLRSADSVPESAASSAALGSNRRAILPRIGITLAVVGVAAVTLSHPSATRIYTWPMAALVTALWWFPMGPLLSGTEKGSVWRTPPPLLFGGLVLLATGTFLSAVLSPFATSLARTGPTFGGIALYLWFHHALTSPDATPAAGLSRVGRALAVAGVILVVVSFIQWSGGSWPLPWGSRNTAPFGHSTYTAGAVVLLLPWIAVQAWATRGIPRALWCAAIGVALVVLAGTSSRGGVLALAFVGSVAAVTTLVLARWSRPRKFAFVVVVFAAGAAAVSTNQRLRDLVLRREWSDSAKESNAQRRAMLAAGVRLGAERPLLGWGPGSVPLAYPRVRAQLDGGTENVLQLHNTPAQIWATAGGIGIVATILILCGTLQAIVRAARTPTAFAATASLLGCGVVALTDHQLDIPLINAGLAAGLAILTASSSASARTIQPTRRTRRLTSILIAIALFFVGRTTLRDLHARQLYDRALTALGSDRPQEFVHVLDQAIAVAPHDPFFQHQAAAGLLKQRANSRDAATQVSLARDAVTRLESSLTAGVHLEFAHFNLGWLLLDLNRPADAARHFRAAAHLVPDKGGVYFGLGLAEQATGNEAAAIRAFALELINDPRHVTSPAWELPALAALQPAVRAEVLRVYAGLRRDAPQAATIEAWTRWWWGENVSTDQMRPAFNGPSSRFVAALPAIQAREPLAPMSFPWAASYAAWRTIREPGASGGSELFLSAAGEDRAFASALARRAQRHPDDFRAFLVAPVEEEPSFLRTFRRQRPGYGVLALHPEGPLLHDAYIVQENRVTADLAADLFPPKGWLPGRFLLALLPEDPR